MDDLDLLGFEGAHPHSAPPLDAQINAAHISFKTGRSPKAFAITSTRRRCSRNSRLSRFVVRITRRWAMGKRSCAAGFEVVQKSLHRCLISSRFL